MKSIIQERIKILLLLVIFLCLTIIRSSGQSCSQAKYLFYNWYFGAGTGLDFNQAGSPALVTSSIQGNGGTVSISNPSGKILFYSNGATVWDKTNNVMPNGYSPSGDSSLAQPVLAFPFPNDYSKYYLFTNGSSGIQYSIIDTTLNGGNGDVTTLNIPVFANSTQKLAGTGDGNGNIWVVTTEKGTNNLEAFKVSSTGVNLTPIVSSVGLAQTDNKGTLKFSQDGTKAALAVPGQSLIEVFDFDKTTGKFSNPISINETGATDIEFSPDNSKLYSVNEGNGEVAQFDLSSSPVNKQTLLQTPGGDYVNSIQLGPDGKIYITHYKSNSSIDVINNPDIGTTANYQTLFSMGNGFNNQYGLPNIVSNLSFNPDFTYQDTCDTHKTSFHGIGEGNPSQWVWDFGDPASGKNSGQGQDTVHTFSNTGNYNVKFSFINSCGTRDTITKSITVNSIPTVTLHDTVVCDTPYVMDAGIAGATYLWSNGKTTQTVSVDAAGKYWVKVTVNGCSNADTANIAVWGQGNKGDYNWMFGNKAGLNFTNSQPNVISNNNSIATSASSSISDPLGNLLFYTDGTNIYNKNNQVMQGGTGLNGNTSPGQSTLIVPYPGANNLYYVFTISSTGEMDYSTVDLSANNGLGEVTNLNTPLTTNVADKLSGVKDDNGNFWVVTHGTGNNQFIAYKIDKNGLSSNPVTSSIGTSETGSGGYLKFSKDGTKAAVAIEGQNIVEVYDFNKTTGVFSNPVTISNISSPYGVEFSEDNSKLYVSTDGDGHLYQYNLNAGGAAAIQSTKTLISTDPSQAYDAIQMGPDGRIYVALGNGSTQLSVINNPSDSLNVGYQDKIINLGQPSNGALPNFIANYFTTSSWGIADADTCSGLTTILQGSAPDTVKTWYWSIDNNNGNISHYSTQTINHTFPGPGTYHVTLEANYLCGDTTLKKDVTIIATPVLTMKDTTLCTATSFILDAGYAGADAYIWSDVTTGLQLPIISQTLTTDTNGTYKVIAVKGGCAAQDAATVGFLHGNSFTLGNDTTLCNGSTLTIDPGAFPGATYTWSTGSHFQSIQVSTSGNYSLTVSVGASCSFSASKNVTFVTPPVVSLGGPAISICQGRSIKIGSNNASSTYKWSTGDITDSITVNTVGKYWLEVTKNGGCVVSDTVIISVVTPPTVDLGPDQTICNGSSFMADAGNPNLSHLWSPGGATSQTLPITSSGNYSVTVTDGPCKVTDDINVTFIPAPVVSLGPQNQFACTGIADTLDGGNPGFSYLWSTNETSQQIFPTSSGTYWVHVYQGNCMRGDTVNLTFQSGPAISLPSEIIFCSEKGDSVTLSPGNASSYLWSPGGATTSQLIVNKQGTYSIDAFSTIGCKSTVSSNVLDICEAKIYIPNIFSPNGDGVNDEFKISGADIKSFHLEIFDRWGELIFVSNDINNSWTGMYRGKIVQEGAYIWKVTYSGETSTGTESHTKTGDVTVIK